MEKRLYMASAARDISICSGILDYTPGNSHEMSLLFETESSDGIKYEGILMHLFG